MSNTKIVTAPITDLANEFADFVASLDVDHLWQRGKAVDWETGEPITEFPVSHTDTHCSAFAAAVAKKVGIYLLQPPDHHPTLRDELGEEFLANAQSFWLNGLYDPGAPSEPSARDEEINPDVITAATAGWSNVADQLSAGAPALDLALAAQNLANAGFLVVASILGNKDLSPGPDPPPPKGPGHIAVLMPADLAHDDLMSNGPAEAQAGDVNSSMTRMKTGFVGHLPGTTVMGSIAAATSFASPKIQFFSNSNPLNIPA